jgi:dihydroorotase
VSDSTFDFINIKSLVGRGACGYVGEGEHFELTDAIRASTTAPAAAHGRTDIGRFEVGAIGDAAVLELAEGDFEYRDVLGEVRAGRQRLKARGLVLAGRWWHPPQA